MNDKVKTVLSSILESFKSGNIPDVVAKAIMFPIPDLPSSHWSLLNRTLMFLSGSADARGYRQWLSVDRHVVKGTKAIYILVPFIKKSDAEDTPGEEKRLMGFGCKPVFRVEDTNGEPFEYQQIELPFSDSDNPNPPTYINGLNLPKFILRDFYWENANSFFS